MQALNLKIEILSTIIKTVFRLLDPHSVSVTMGRYAPACPLWLCPARHRQQMTRAEPALMCLPNLTSPEICMVHSIDSDFFFFFNCITTFFLFFFEFYSLMSIRKAAEFILWKSLFMQLILCKSARLQYINYASCNYQLQHPITLFPTAANSNCTLFWSFFFFFKRPFKLFPDVQKLYMQICLCFFSAVTCFLILLYCSSSYETF